MFKSIVIFIIFSLISSCVSIPYGCCDFEPTPRKSFVKIIASSTEGLYTGSGVIIDHILDSYTIILTAGHICKDNVLYMGVLDYEEQEYAVLYMATSSEDDICAIITTTLINVKPSSVSYFKPEIGDKVYNIAAPIGIHSKNMSLIFDGYYGGNMIVKNEKHYMSVFSIPAKGGSSGSPIYNQNWEIIGIVSRAYSNFENTCVSVSHERILNFISKIKTSINKLEKN